MIFRQQRLITTAVTALVIFMNMSGCTSHQVLRDSGPDIQEVYTRHIGGQRGAPARPDDPEDAEASSRDNNGSSPDKKSEHRKIDAIMRPVADDRADLADYTRHAANEIEQLFPLLPNPQLVLYVFPHFTAKGRPVPGYTTVFRMYEKDEYGMPGEWISDHPETYRAREQVEKQRDSSRADAYNIENNKD